MSDQKGRCEQCIDIHHLKIAHSIGWEEARESLTSRLTGRGEDQGSHQDTKLSGKKDFRSRPDTTSGLQIIFNIYTSCSSVSNEGHMASDMSNHVTVSAKRQEESSVKEAACNQPISH